MSSRQKINRDTVPEGFTVRMAAVDSLPVILFGISTLITGIKMNSILFTAGAALALAAGICKVIWKFIAAIKQLNIWTLFIQMRILMPIGMVMMLLSAFLKGSSALKGIMTAFSTLPSAPFLIAGVCGMILMGVFAAMLDSSDPVANWTEQLTNTAAQLLILIGILVF